MPGTIVIATSRRHRGGWQVSTSTAGIQEAIAVLGSGGGTVSIPAGMWALHSRITLSSNVRLQGAGLYESVLQVPSGEYVDTPAWRFGLTPSAAVILGPPGASRIAITGLSIVFDKQAHPPNGSYGIIFIDARDSIVDRVAVRNGPILTHGNTFLPIGILGLSEGNLVQNSIVNNQVCTVSSEGAGGFIADGRGNRFLHNYVFNGCNSGYVTQGFDTVFEGNVFDLGSSFMVPDSQAFANDNGSGARFVNNVCLGNGAAPACFAAVTDLDSRDTVDSSFSGNRAWNCSEAYQFQSTVARSREITVQGGEIVNCAVPVSVLGILDHVSIVDAPGAPNLHSQHLYAITVHSGWNKDIELGDADTVWLSGATAGFSVTGLEGGWEGRVVEVVNASNWPAQVRVCGPDGANILLPKRYSAAVLRYSVEDRCRAAAPR